MLSRYRLTLSIVSASTPQQPQPEWAFRLYACLMEQTAPAFAAWAHANAITPVSQFLQVRGTKLLWTVSLLGEASHQALGDMLEREQELYLRQGNIHLRVESRDCQRLASVEQLFAAAADDKPDCCRLDFCTPTAFKSQGQYLNLPTTRLILQSLLKQWNGCLPNCPIEDEDGQGLDALAAGISCQKFSLRSRDYLLKGQSIPGFCGSLVLANHLSGFHRQLAQALLHFSAYSGVGIKTALGMGGVEQKPL